VPWQVHWGGIGNPQGGLEGQLTKCRLGGVVFYVRENIAFQGGHFQVSSGERMGWKQGRLSRRHQQILELAAPPGQWDRIAALVHRVDGLKRPVRSNRRFTIPCPKQFSKKHGRTSDCVALALLTYRLPPGSFSHLSL
jgi:hypothetical protein